METGHSAHGAEQTIETTAETTGITIWILDTFDAIWERKGAFFAIFFTLFCISYGFLVWIDFVPEEPKEKVHAVAVITPVATSTEVATVPVVPANIISTNPVHIRIEKINMDVAILNPESTSVPVLDAALLKGAVRHPDSADFKDTGTMVLFGHSSYLPKVFNKNYQAFNGIQKLTEGDFIHVQSADTDYTYHVTKVYKATASQASVSLEKGTPRLILVTCNSFGSKDDRFVVEADFSDKTAL